MSLIFEDDVSSERSKEVVMGKNIKKSLDNRKMKFIDIDNTLKIA